MTQANNPQTTSETFLCRGGTPEKTISDLGPLAHLVGTWMRNVHEQAEFRDLESSCRNVTAQSSIVLLV